MARLRGEREVDEAILPNALEVEWVLELLPTLVEIYAMMNHLWVL